MQGSREWVWVYATISNGNRQRRRIEVIEPNYIIPPLVDSRFSYACVWNCGKRRKWRKRERKCFHS